MNEWNPPLPGDVADRLKQIVGLDDPDQQNPLHVKLVNAVYRTRNLNLGAQIQAVRFVFNWFQLDGGQKKAALQADYDHLIAAGTTQLLMEAEAAGKKLTRKEAEQRVEGSDEAYRLKLDLLAAQHHEQSMRKFLDTLDSATETWRTDRADDRATGDLIARGMGGQA